MSVVADRFELGPVIAEGGGGVVHHAWDRHDASPVALKLLHPRGNPMDLLREVKTLAGLEHPRIVRYVAYGTTADRRTFIATEWLEGHTLATAISAGPLSIADAAGAVAAAADGLRVAHARGVVHRDIKPSNLFLVRGVARDLKIIDFGVASTSERLQAADRGGMAGTPAYLSPEQARRATVDSRADMFSLGCVLHECLTGQRPFAGTDLLVLLGKVQFEEVRPARELRPEVPPALDRLLASMLAKAANRRPSMEEVVATLTALFPAAAPVPPRARTAERRDAPPALGLSDREERVWTVLMARGAHGGTQAAVRALAAEAAAEAASGARLDRPEVLADGTPVLVFGDGQAGGDGAETDPGPLGAARVALRVRAALPDASISLATGRGQLIGRLPLGALLDRGARLLSLCPAGKIELDEETARLVEDRFQLGTEPGGSPEVIVLERERAAGRHEPREVLGRATPFVGREAELSRLEQLVLAAFAGSEAQVVLVTGEAGIGKSRLRHELVQRLELRPDPPDVALASGNARGGASPAPFALIEQLVRSLGGDTHLSAALGGESPEPGPLPAATGDDPLALFDEVRAAWLRWLAGRLRRRPVLLLVEDAHAADRPSLELLAAARARFKASPLVLVGLARAGAPLAEGRAGWPEPAIRLPLGPLAPESCAALAADLAGSASPETTALAARSGGNPFFLEELVRARGAVPGAAGLPDTVMALVQARIDRLAPPLRRLLRAASVLRGGFDLATLRALVREEGDDGAIDLPAALAQLVREELLVPGDAAPVRYAFRQGIGQEAAYATLTEGDRALGHRLAARWLAQQHGAGHPAGNAASPADIADHFEQAGDRPQAGPWFARAAELALHANDLDQALALAERAHRCGLRPDELTAVKIVEARTRFWRAEYLEAETSARRGLRGARTGSAPWFRCLAELGAALGERGEYAELERLVHQAQAQRPDRGAEGHRASCLLTSIGYLAVSGRRQTARALLEGLVSPAAAAPGDDIQARIHSCRALLAAAEGDTWMQSEETRRALELYERTGNVRRRCEMMADLGSAAVELGDLDRGIELLRQVVAEADRLGAARVATAALVNLVQALAWRGLFDDATALAGTALDSAREQGNRRLEAGCFAFLAEAALLAGRSDEGERHARRALARAGGLEAIRPAILAVLAWALLERNQVPEAVTLVEEAQALVDAEGRPEVNESLLHWVRARALAMAGDQPRADEASRTARSRLEWRAAQIADPVIRDRFLQLPHSRHILALVAAAG